MSMLSGVEIVSGPVEVETLLSRWYSYIKDKNMGAFIPFVGIVRDESGIDGLSFDIYEPILNSWFNSWQNRALDGGGELLMTHSKGDVLLHKSSFVAAVASRKRRFGLEFIDLFVEDFKRSAPIWKYDIVDGERVYARDRSYRIDGAGILELDI